MNTYADKNQDDKSQSERNEFSSLQFVDNRPEAIRQRKQQEMANNSPLVIQQKASQDMMNGIYSRKPPLQRKENSQQVIQRVYDDTIFFGKFNLVGENHNKSEIQRENEDKLAKERGLTYFTENEYHVANDEKGDRADPTNLRLLFAFSRIRESVKSIVSQRSQNPAAEIESIKYIVDNMTNDIKDFNNQKLIDLFKQFKKDLKEKKVEEVLRGVIDMTQEVAPGQTLGGSRDLSQGRSESMHDVADSDNKLPIMWMVGQNHTDDIDKEYPNRKYKLLKQNTIDKGIEELGSGAWLDEVD